MLKTGILKFSLRAFVLVAIRKNREKDRLLKTEILRFSLRAFVLCGIQEKSGKKTVC